MKKLKLMTILGTRPEIIKMSEIIKKSDKYFDHILVHTGQNYDYTLNEVFFTDLGIRKPDYYLGVVGESLGQTMGNVISKAYELMVQTNPDAIIVLGDTNSCLSVIAAKRLKIPIFTWKLVIDVRMRIFRRRLYVESWMSQATLICVTLNMHAVISLIRE